MAPSLFGPRPLHIALCLTAWALSACDGGPQGVDAVLEARLAPIRETGTRLSGSSKGERAATQWKAWLVGGEPALIEEVVQIEEWGTTTNIYLFEDDRLTFYHQTGQRPTGILGGVGLQEIALELRWEGDEMVAGAKSVDREVVEVPEWEAAVARERARNLRALVMEAARAQRAAGVGSAGSKADTSP
jgi:hypothetical protein